MTKKIATTLVFLFSVSTYAGECKIWITRKACPGKEVAAFKPYNGKETTEESKKVDSEKACSDFADTSSKIVRKGTLSEKIVKASFDSKDLGKTFSDKAECK